MKTWDAIPPQPCWDGHLLAAVVGGWEALCHARPERWQTMESQPTDEPLVVANSEAPSCEVCAMILKRNEAENLTKANWPIEWRPYVIHVCDQSGQPYGSMRRCCNRCGIMVSRDLDFVDNFEDYNASPFNCSKVKS